MPDSYGKFEAKIKNLILDAGGKITQDGLEAAIDEAINIRFSSDRPLEIVTDMEGNATNDLGLPPQFADGFSIVRSIEYPVGNIPESYVDPSDFRMYRAPSGLTIRLLVTQPNTGEPVRVTWTARQTTDSVPDGDFEAVCAYAAALCFDSMAASYIQTVDGMIPGDTVNYRSKAQECQSVAKSFRTRYYNHIGAGESSGSGGSDAPAQAPAFSTGNIHEELQPGMDRILHNKYTR